MAPRWTYSEANAAKWRHLFDELIDGSMALEVPLEGNGKSLCSLRIRISDALKWLADRFRAGDSTMEPYARLKGRLRYKAADSALHLQVRQSHAFRAIQHLDPALHARLVSALQPNLNPQTRAKIEALLEPERPFVQISLIDNIQNNVFLRFKMLKMFLKFASK